MRPWLGLRVARPDGPIGQLARVASVLFGAALLIPALLARLPASWVAASGGTTIPLRFVLVVGVIWGVSALRAVVYTRLPRARYVVGRTLVLHERGHRRRIPLARVTDVFVELRPTPVHQVFMVELDDGTVHEICPVAWSGAGRLYQGLRQALEWRASVDAHAERRASRARASR